MKKWIQFLINLIKYRSLIIGNVRIERGAFIRYSVIKGNVNIGKSSSVFRANLIGNISIGEYTAIVGPFTYIHCVNERIACGNRCAIAPNTTIITSGHDRHSQAKSFSSGGVRTEKPITIGDDVWIGAGTVIVGNCTVSNNVSVGAGSVLLGKDYQAGKFICGVPAVEK